MDDLCTRHLWSSENIKEPVKDKEAIEAHGDAMTAIKKIMEIVNSLKEGLL